MAPEHCPQQRLNEVVSVPLIHDKLKPKIDWLNPLQKRRPKGSPRKLSFLCSVEWAWSPMHNRIDNYYLNPRRDGWLLWINRLNDHTVPWTWWWDFVAYANKCKAEDEEVFQVDINNLENGSEDRESNKVSEKVLVALEHRLEGTKGSLLTEVQSGSRRCAWYQPIHYFDHSWGIFIRQDCIDDTACSIIDSLNTEELKICAKNFRQSALKIQLAAFLKYYLHEQFHHKVESAGFRLLMSRREMSPVRSCYLDYKKNIYRAYYPQIECIEETAANNDAFQRTYESKYQRMINPFQHALRRHMKTSFPKLTGPAYAASGAIISQKREVRDRLIKSMLLELQSQLLSGEIKHKLTNDAWQLAPQLIRSLFDYTQNIWVIVPKKTSVFLPTTHSAAYLTCSSREAISALEKYYGYKKKTGRGGGKGSHSKMEKVGCSNIHIPRAKNLSIGVVNHMLEVTGDLRNHQLRDFLGGKFS